MKKMLESPNVINTKIYGKISKNKTSNLILKLKNIVIIAILLLLCSFSNNVEAREELPEDIIQAKENAINEIILGANEGITLTRTYETGTESINLQWNSVSGATTYKVFQSKNGAGESLLTTVQGTSVTLNKANAGIKDEAAPSMPTVTATQDADGTGNNITITASTDNGTTYRHRIEEKMDNSNINGDVLFLIDLSGTMKNFRNLFSQEDGPILSISKQLIEEYNMRIGTMVMAHTSSSMIRGGFTQNLNTIREYIKNFRGRDNHLFSIALTEAIQTLEAAGGKNKIIILFSDCDSDYDSDFENSASIAAKKANLVKMKEAGIKLYTIYRATDSRLYMDQYSNAFIVQPEVDKGKQVEAFNKIFKNIIEELAQKSNTVSTTVTTGIKGYQYAITTNSVHTFTNEKIVSIADIPTYVSGEEQMVQYLHIRAVDNSGNVSATKSVLLQVPAKVTLETDYLYGMNEVPLNWTINDKRAGYVYRLYQKEEGQETFTQISSSNSIEVIKEQGTKTVKYTTSGTYTWTIPEGVTKLRVAVAGAGGRRCGSIRRSYCTCKNRRNKFN